MRILSADQHRALDRATMSRDNLNGSQLMERATTAFVKSFVREFTPRSVLVVCGSGNNGGDGLAAARQLIGHGFTVTVWLLELGEFSADNRVNQNKGARAGAKILTVSSSAELPPVTADLIIDAIFGTGLSRPPEGLAAAVIDRLNATEVTRVALDLPSGLRTDGPSEGSIFRADRTFSMGYPKLCLFAPAAARFTGNWSLVPFDTDDAYVVGMDGHHHMMTREEIGSFLHRRSGNDYKGTFGHALLVAGSYGKIGAATLSARAVMRSGTGLLTVHLPRCGYTVMQLALPEAMCTVDSHEYVWTDELAVTGYQTIGVGPGLGTGPLTARALELLLSATDKPMVIDADALNLIAKNGWFRHIPKGSILTPHPGEFRTLFGETADDFARWEMQRKLAVKHGLVILLKTGHTAIATPDGQLYFNTSGNPGMGTAGMGDTLTGILTGLLAQGYTPSQSARLGVYLHGLAGDLAADAGSEESLLAGDLIGRLGAAFVTLRS